MPRDALLFGPPSMDSLQSFGDFHIELNVNPLLPAKISVDGKLFTAPTTLSLPPGSHQFSAINNIPDINSPGVAYTFQCWLVNGVCVSQSTTTIIHVPEDMRGKNVIEVTAQYMLGESGWGSPARPDSLPNPTGPMTPNLILVNPGPKEV